MLVIIGRIVATLRFIKSLIYIHIKVFLLLITQLEVLLITFLYRLFICMFYMSLNIKLNMFDNECVVYFDRGSYYVFEIFQNFALLLNRKKKMLFLLA